MLKRHKSAQERFKALDGRNDGGFFIALALDFKSEPTQAENAVDWRADVVTSGFYRSSYDFWIPHLKTHAMIGLMGQGEFTVDAIMTLSDFYLINPGFALEYALHRCNRDRFFEDVLRRTLPGKSRRVTEKPVDGYRLS
ncbi:hypothetical protein ACLPJK_25870 [Pseudomonas aeruginosa]|uniref:hypothetical protein n=1 Tax=Pseudomonas aeruginosa TaxID=287 RepID=UPI003D2BDA92